MRPAGLVRQRSNADMRPDQPEETTMSNALIVGVGDGLSASLARNTRAISRPDASTRDRAIAGSSAVARRWSSRAMAFALSGASTRITLSFPTSR